MCVHSLVRSTTSKYVLPTCSHKQSNLTVFLLILSQPYFVKKYLNLLRSEGYLRYIKNEWTWDIAAISTGTNISDNVAEIMERKIQMLHPNVQSMLEIASCLGFQFPRDILNRFAVENLVDGDMTYEVEVRDHLTKCLKVAIKEGLVEPTRSVNKYTFSHFRVQ
jgi:predicted ATPase